MASSSNVNSTSQRANSSNALQLATSMNQTNRFDTQTQAELLILIQQYLGTDPKYKEVAAKLQEALEINQVLPVRYDIEGNAHPQTLASFLENVRMYSTSLPDMFQRLCQLQAKFAPPPVRGLPIRFFTSRKTALDRKTHEKFVAPPLIQSVICTRPSPVAMQSMHPVKFLLSRELGRNMPLLPKQMFRKEYMQTLNRHARIMGHLSSIFCVAFDRSGRYVFTGADDNLIKCWDVYQYLLRFTFRGHIGEISDLSVSHENSLLASGSVDKTVRIWSLRNGSTIRVYKGHSATINSIAFVPLFFEGSDLRYIVSAGNDCAVVFHRYNESTKQFLDPPFKFNERATGGARIISSSHSPGGNIVIMGDTHQAIIVYQLNEDRVDRLYEFTAHSDRVDTLVWSHHSLRFASGSKDGSAKAWSISGGQWTSRELVVPNSETTGADGMNAADGRRQRTANSTQTTSRKNAQNAYKVTMLTWSLDDDLVISIGSDYLLRTWDWKTGTMLGKFAGHQNETFSLMAHPLHRELVVSAGHDGLIIVWNIYTGKQLCRHRNVNNNREAVAIFDMAIGPDGSTVCCVDSMGCLGIYGVSNNQFAMTRPHEQFFSTDYRLIQIDADGIATDEDTGLLPELLAPPFFVTSNGDLHSEKEQRLVPGNDIKSNEIVKPCAWLKRDIIGPLRPSIVEKYKNEHIEHCRLEQMEFERDQMLVPIQPNAIQQIVIPVEQMNTRQRRPTNSSTTRTRGTGRSAELRQLAEYIMQNPVPRYVLDEDYTDDENDRSFSLGSDEEEEEGEEFVPRDANRQVGDEHAEDESESSDEDNGEEGEEVAENGEEDENDSDYEVGRHEHATVFRERSTWTVTGKRKRRPPVAVEQEQSSSSQDRLAEENRYRSERLRSRAAARAALLLDASQPTSSSAALAQTAVRRIKTRRTAFIASSDGEDAEEAKIEPKKEERKKQRGQKVRSRKVDKRRRIQQRRIQIEHDDGEEEDLNEEEEEIGRKSTRKLANRRGNRMTSVNSSTARQHQQMSEDEAAENSFGDNVGRLYPDWMRKTRRGRFPFIPQLGDLVVYFQQGHRAYFDELKKRKIRVPSQFDVQSFLDVQEICYIDEIKYTTLRKGKQRIHVADLRLARTKSNKRCGTSFHICYHDMEDSIDFLVLKQHFDASMAMKLTDGDRIESIVDEEIYTGIVTKIDAYEPEYPNSEWSSVSVCWDNGDTDRFNPWDLQKSIRTRRATKTVATPADLDKLGEYHPVAGDWLVPDEILGDSTPAKAQQLYLDRAMLAINQLSQLNCLKEFAEPVNLEVYTNYVDIVVYPIDLRTISERIHHHFYRRSLSFLSDVQYLAKNADKFNDPDTEIGAFIQCNAIILVETIFTFMENWDEKSPRDLFNRFGEYDLHKLQAWKRRLHPACSKMIGGGISGDDDQLLRRLSNRSSNGAMESTSAAANQPGTSGTQNLQKSTRAARAAKKNEMPLWTVECNDLVEHLNNIFMNGVNNRDMNNSAYAFICNLRTKTDLLLQKCRKPESFLNQIRDFLKAEKNRVNDAESRRSKTYQAILNMELHLDTSKQPIMAKYNRMMAEAESRQKRKAAVTAQLQWRHLDDDEEEEEIYVKKRPKAEPVDESVSSDELSNEDEEMDVDKEEEEEDGLDSDFEVGRHNRGSALIGKRNRQPPLVPETHYRSRLRTRPTADILLDPSQPSSSSAAANATYTSSGRRIKPTRRGSFVGSSDGDDGEFEEQRTSKKKRKIN